MTGSEHDGECQTMDSVMAAMGGFVCCRTEYVRLSRRVTGPTIGQGYAHLSEPGRAMAEWLELSALHSALRQHDICFPNRVLKSFVSQVAKSMIEHRLDPDAVFAAASLRSEDKSIWQSWLNQHIEKYPHDEIDMLDLERNFATTTFGALGRRLDTSTGRTLFVSPWKMAFPAFTGGLLLQDWFLVRSPNT